MKLTRKITALLAVLTLLCSLWTPIAVSAEAPAPVATQPQAEETVYFGRSILAQMKNGEALCYAYDRLVAGCETLSDYVDIAHRTHRINSDEAFLVWEAATNDHPEYFWLSDGMSLWGSGAQISAFAPYVYDGIAAEQAQLNARIAELTAGLEGKSDYEKSLILHDRVCEAVVYRGSAYDQNVIGSLVMGQAVCAGYARAYQLLLQSVGIPAYVVTGHSKGQGHAWNLVQLDGEQYYTDVTWDDQNDNGGHIYYAYLNVTYAQMSVDHTIESFADYLPKTTATAANYHTVHGTAMDMPSAEKMAELYEAGLTIRLYMTGNQNTFINALSSALSETVDQIACPYSGYSCSTGYLGHEIIINLVPTNPHNYGSDNVCKNCGHAKEIPVLPGDADGNGKVNNRDLGVLQQYLNEWEVTVNLAAADVDGNGKINNRDLGTLQRILNE